MNENNMPIRILHIVTYMGRGGLETMLMNYYRHMDRDKVQFDFLVHRDFEADYDQEILDMGGKIFHVSRLIPWSKSYRSELKTFFNEHPEYRIVHVHQDCLSSVALECAKECGIPVRIGHSHNSNQDRNLKYLIKKIYMRKIPTYATELFACGKSAGDWMFRGKKYQILYNAIDTDKYTYSCEIAKEVRQEIGISDELLIGHVGRFRLQKNHTFLLDIFFEVLKINSKAKLLLIGDGEEFHFIQEKAKKLGIDKNVIFAGSCSNVNKLMQAMDIFIFPSLYEGLPVTMIETQSAGLRCVISEQVSDECIVTNNLVTVKKLTDSAKDWAQHILTQCEYTRESHKQEIALAGYDISIAAEKLQKFYIDKSEE